jgi:hypothetical protein
LDLLDVAAEDGLVLFSGHVSLLFPEPPPLGLWHHHGASRTSLSHLLEGLFTQVLRREILQEGKFCELRHNGVLRSSLVGTEKSTNTQKSPL